MMYHNVVDYQHGKKEGKVIVKSKPLPMQDLMYTVTFEKGDYYQFSAKSLYKLLPRDKAITIEKGVTRVLFGRKLYFIDYDSPLRTFIAIDANGYQRARYIGYRVHCSVRELLFRAKWTLYIWGIVKQYPFGDR